MLAREREIEVRLELARQIAQEAADGTLAYFCSRDLKVEQKEDLSPVTIADREAERLLRKRIEASFPDDGIEGEEFGSQPGKSAFRWLLDPIDGTKSFVSGVPLFGTMVAVLCEDEPQIGVMEFPALGESIYAARGQGAWHSKVGKSPVASHVSAVDRLSYGLFCTTAIETFESTGRFHLFQSLQHRARLTRTWGDCYGYLLVATGRAELMVDPELNPWDTAALLPILEEAGGTLTDFSGEKTVFGGEAVATNGHIFPEVLKLISA
ncbi:MAG: histidinol-phosphatase [Planctomycetaceae bacterium TMED10]|nr:MAG: histidinol-phosphatase [Planctomycetaceae bacterium TMED10]